MSSDGSSSRNSSPAAKEPPDPPHRGDSSRSFYYSTTTTISTKSSGPSETDSDELNADKASGPSEADSESITGRAPSDPSTAQFTKTTGLEDSAGFSDASAAAMLSAFQYGPKEDTAPRCATVSSSSSSSAKPSTATTVSDPLGLLRQSDRIASAAAQSAADAARERASRSKKKRRPEKSEEQLRKERLAANRRSAAASRQRRKILIEELQNSIASLVKENANLRRENDELKEQLEQLREENRKLAENLTAERDCDESSMHIPLDTINQTSSITPQPAVGDAQAPQFPPTSTANAMTGLGLGLRNVGGAHAFHSPNPPNHSINNNYMQGGPLFGSAGVPQPVVVGPVGAFPPANTVQQQPQNSQTAPTGLPPMYAQLNDAQINQELLRRCPPHVLRMLLARQQQP